MTRAAVWAVALLLMTVVDVPARGGRGGGGFARGGFSRGGVAAGGSFGASRPAGGARRGGYERRGPAASGTFPGRSSDRWEQRQDVVDRRQERRDERREDWQEHAGERREDWQEYLDDHYDERYQPPVYYYGDYYPYGDDYQEGAAVIEGQVAEEAVGAPPSWTLDCEPTTVILGSTTYYQCGSAWYVRVYSGGEIAYTMVNPPAGR